jgi:hypothetical protein
MAGAQFDERLAIFDPDGAEDVDRLAGAAMIGDAGTFDEEQIGRGGTVQNRQFRAVDVDDQVIDAAGGQGGHQMLDGADAGLGLAGQAEDGA